MGNRKRTKERVLMVEAPNGWEVRVPESKLADWAQRQAQRSSGKRELSDFERRVKDKIVSMVYD